MSPGKLVDRKSPRANALAATIVGLAALAMYLVTLYPGLGGGGDAAKFQYVGSVLGTPHPPGYPLYVLVSYVFSQIPIGSLAYRINLMSAVCGAAAVVWVFLTLRRLQCHLAVAMCAALCLAFDRLLWARSVGAEVYALNGALVALIVWLAVRWSESGRDRDLYLTVGAFAISLGNHLTVVTLAPALVVFVVLTRPQSVNVRTVIVSASIVLLGVAQYGLIVLRTYQGAAYLEATARTFRELVDVMRASRFEDQIFAFGLHELLTKRVPLFWDLALVEFNPVGLALVALGVVVGIVQRRSDMVLLAGSAAGITLLTLNVGADVDGFLVAASVPAWALAGIGLQAAWVRVQGVRVRAGIALAAIGLVALPLWQVSRNYRANDHHRRTYEIRYFRALFAALEPRAAIVREGYATDQAVLYKLIGERAAGRRWITLVPPDRDAVIRLREAGYAVYAFSDGKRTLQDRGLEFEPITLEDVEGAPEERAIDMTPSLLYRLVRVDLCEDIGNVGWRDITHLASGGQLQVRIDDYRPFDASVLFYAAGGLTQDPTTLVIAQGPHRPTLTSTSFLTSRPADRARLDAALRQDQVTDPAALARAPVVQRSELRVNDRGEFVLSMLAWRSRPLTLRARAVVDLNNPRRAIVCGWSRREFFAAALAEPVAIDETESQLFGQGWRPPEPMNEGGHMRRTSANEQEAEILVPLARTGRIRIRVRARALGSVEVHTVALAINGRRVSLQVITHAWTTFEWVVPADHWATGFNRLTFASAEPGGEVGIAVNELSFELVPPTGTAVGALWWPASSRDRREYEKVGTALAG